MIYKSKLILLFCFIIFSIGCGTKKLKLTTMISKEMKIDKKVDSLLKLMTLEEKIGQLNQYSGFYEVTGPAPTTGDAALKYTHLKKGLVGSMLNVRGVQDIRALQKIAVEQTRLKIPLLFGFDVIHGYKTISPIPLAEAASWDLEAIKKSASIAAEEASAAGLNWTFAPMVDISRDARWGRVMEGAGEDPYLGSKIATARVQGFQGNDLAANNTILACVKHFAAYGWAEAGREYNTVDISETVLQNTIFPPFKAALNAGVRTFMNSFNELNGIPATGSNYLLNELLKGAWNFDGFVVSDWGSIKEMAVHGYATDDKHATELAINAGTDMDMESSAYLLYLLQSVADGKVQESTINNAVKRVLKVKFELGLFDDPFRYCDIVREVATIGKQDFQEGVLDMAKKSIVLLKNQNNLLPLKKSGQKIAVIGALANDKTSPLGSWSTAADANSAVSVLEGLKKYTGNPITYAEGASLVSGRTEFVYETQINTTDKSGFEEAIKIAKNANVVIMVLGEHGLQSGEGRSRTQIDLPGVQQELLEAVYQVNQNIVLVLNNGRPLAITWADENIPAIVEAWQLGTQSGNAIAQVLYGDYNPSGKLPMTFPRNVGQIPIYYNHKNTGRPTMTESENVFWSHYIDEKNTPLYPFGHGLSYTTFDYSNLNLSSKSFTKNGNIKVDVTIKNSGNVAGKEVVQLYIRDLVGSTTRPVKELKGFELAELQVGEERKISFTIDEKTIEFFTANRKWEAEKGDFTAFVGGSSHTTLEASFEYK